MPVRRGRGTTAGRPSSRPSAPTPEAHRRARPPPRPPGPVAGPTGHSIRTNTVVGTAKKRGRKASKEECQEVLGKIRAAAESVKGATELRSLDGVVGGFATVMFQGKAGAA